MDTSIKYIELVARSHYSFLQGASHPKELLSSARDLGYRGIGLCDLNGFYGSIQGYEAYLNQSPFKSAEAQSNIDPKKNLDTPFSYLSGVELILDQHTYIIYPKNLESYQTLCRFLSEQHQIKDLLKSPEVDLSNAFYSFSDCFILALPPWDLISLKRFHSTYPKSFYLALYRNFTRQSFSWQQQAFQLEENEGYSLVACQRVLFARPEDKELYDLLGCIKSRTTFDQNASAFLKNREHYLKPLSSLHNIWQDRLDLLNNTFHIAQDIHFSWNQIRYHYPKAKILNNQRAIDHLKDLCLKNIPERLSHSAYERHKPQLEKELHLIEELKYEDYFLTLHEICQFAKSQNILHQGRGSAANSIVCYLLGLTSVHPDKIQMLFERFISKERQEPPDIDIDFDSLRREEVIQFIFKRYGAQHAAQVANVICFRHKSALREAGIALGIEPKTIVRIQNQLDRVSQDDISLLISQIQNLHQNKTWNLNQDQVKVQDIDTRPNLNLKKWLLLAHRLLETPRHLGLHSGGFVLTDIPLDSIVPIEKATHPGRYMIQWNKDDIETLSMMKIDVLGLGMLNALNKAFSLLAKHKHVHLEMYKAPENDPKTFEMIQKAKTIGTFQIESRAQMSMLPKLRPKNYYDLVMQIAMVRPGPIEGGLIGPFLKNRNLKIKPQYPMPELAPVLDRTHGVPIFQEQIMQVMMIAANFTPGEADQMRRLLGQASKKRSQMKALSHRIIKGMRANGIDDSFIRQILNTIKGFSAYGFPESHSASFAHISYISCYLKCHHPDVFVCSLLNSQPMGFYHPRTLIQEAKSNQVTFLPLHILKSKWEYTLENPKSVTENSNSDILLAVRQGFLSLQNLQKSTVTQLHKWQNHVSHKIATLSTQDLLKSLIFETEIPDKQISLLIQSGAFYFTQSSIAEILWAAKSLIMDRKKPLSQMIQDLSYNFTSVQLPKMSTLNQLEKNYKSFGYSLEAHPVEWLRAHDSQLKNQQLIRSHQLTTCRQNQNVSILGLVAIKQRPPTANGVCFLSLEDEHGLINIILWPNIFKKYKSVINQHHFLIVTGSLQKKEGVVNVLATHIWPVELRCTD